MCIVDISELKHFPKEIHFSVLIVGLLSSKYRWLLETLPNGAYLSLSSFSKTAPQYLHISDFAQPRTASVGVVTKNHWFFWSTDPEYWYMWKACSDLLASILSAFITLQMLYLNSAYNKSVSVSDAEWIKNISDSLTRFWATSRKFKYWGKGSNLQMNSLPSWILCIQYDIF